MTDSEILNAELETQSKYGSHTIAVKEIFNGNFAIDNQPQTKKSDEINAKIGTVVNNYNAESLEWQVYYSDESETFFISKQVINEFTSSRIPTKGNGKDNNYSGSTDVANFAYGLKWNSKWLSKCDTNNESQNAQKTAYMCDPDNWVKYKTGAATYAVGGPTIELLFASLTQSQDTNIELDLEKITSYGYTESGCYPGFTLSTSMNNGIYNSGAAYTFASPCDQSGARSSSMPIFRNDYGAIVGAYIGTGLMNDKVRPIVSIPTSKISISGDTVTVLP